MGIPNHHLCVLDHQERKWKRKQGDTYSSFHKMLVKTQCKRKPYRFRALSKANRIGFLKSINDALGREAYASLKEMREDFFGKRYMKDGFKYL